MANRGLDLTIEEELLENPSRRRFLRGSSIALLAASGFAPALASAFESSIEDKDKIDVRFYNRTPGVKREYAPLNSGVNPPWPRADFKQHQARTGFKAGGLPGIDYSSSDLSTEVASPAKGIVYGYNTSNHSGLVIAVYHGLGYITSYAHMRNRFAERSDIIPRGAVVGSGGGAGSGAARSHIHLNTYGPAFTPYLKNVIFDFRPRGKYPYQYALDGEQFSIDNSRQLPYIDKGDFVFDDIFWKKHIEASFYADDLLKEIGTEEARSLLKRSEVEIRRDTALNVDARVRYLYELINQGKSPLSKNDNDKIRAKLIEYMSTTPALTAPIKNDATPELYKVLRTSPLYTWE